ncbi:hypothetical protein GCM10007359_09780 [Rothia aerolata]|uniref:Uncharacterized protein n=1 Tax=Rothia aerolata TaxID=1812262 RepID=A0A917IQS1_9MICC|nr:hypothetical protein GCM10007359_09780 [Rothia aerolata]
MNRLKLRVGNSGLQSWVDIAPSYKSYQIINERWNLLPTRANIVGRYRRFPANPYPFLSKLPGVRLKPLGQLSMHGQNCGGIKFFSQVNSGPHSCHISGYQLRIATYLSTQ